MAKKAALSLRISETVKARIDDEAAKDRRSTASLVEMILADWMDAKLNNRPKKYLTPDEQISAGGELMSMLLPTGKTLGEATAEELEAVGKAWLALAGKVESSVPKRKSKRT